MSPYAYYNYPPNFPYNSISILNDRLDLAGSIIGVPSPITALWSPYQNPYAIIEDGKSYNQLPHNLGFNFGQTPFIQ
jgi:hypothetical protein